MAEPINLNRFRKARAKAEDKTQASQNRARFGRSKAERSAALADADLVRRRLDAVRREPKAD